MTVGERIKEVRTKLKMSQVDFADKINVSKQTLYKYENNIITNVPSDKIEAIAKIGHISPAYLMGWSTREKAINLFTGNMNLDCITLNESAILELYRILNSVGKSEAYKRIEELTLIEKYVTNNDEFLAAAHERTDIEVTEEMRKHDDDIMNDDSEWE